MFTETDVRPYTIEELHERIAISEKQLANGEWMDFDEAMEEIERELDKEELEELKMAVVA